MNIKAHLTGFAVAYENIPTAKVKTETPGRYQGSLYSQQKHAIANAVEWMRLNALHKPRIFVATSPGFVDPLDERKTIKSLTHNLRNGYGLKHYVWVRENTGNGFPHWHFVADLPQFDPVKLSLYWSSLFGVDSKNSIRLGTRPGRNGKRHFWIKNSRMAWYMSKYIGKDINLDQETGEVRPGRKPYQTFRISAQAAQMSQPVIYQAEIKTLYTGFNERIWVSDDFEAIERGAPGQISANSYSWKWTGRGQTYVGFKKARQAVQQADNR